MNKRIYLSSPHMGDKEFEFVKDAFETNWIAPVGPHVDLFEKEFCELTGSKYAVALSSGTAAIHLALILLNVQHDEVICSSFTQDYSFILRFLNLKISFSNSLET